jgi:putative serine protease PepD
VAYDDSDDARHFEPPLPPEDRLWRHPSELAGSRPDRSPPPFPALADSPLARRSIWGVAAASAAVGAVVAAGLLITMGVLRDDDPAVERRVTPAEPAALSEVAQDALGSIARIEVSKPEGTVVGGGVVFRDDGHVLTSADLLAGAERATVTMQDGQTYDATVVGTDGTNDVGVARIEGTEPAAAMLGSADELTEGEAVIVISPAPVATSGPVVTRAIIAARDLRVPTGPQAALHGMLRLSGELGELSPGAVVVDQAGAVVAVVTARRSTTADDDPDEDHYAIPIDFAHFVAGQIVGTGRATHPWLGIEGADASAGGDVTGAEVERVEMGGPADLAGLEMGDVIVTVDGSSIDRWTDLVVAVRTATIGEVIDIEYERDGAIHTARPTVIDQP